MVKLDTIWTRRKDISEERLSICRTCDFFNQTSTRCSKCGCFMEYKSLLLYVDCPIGKWGAINTDETGDK
jgi:hypothetical protein